MLARASIQKPCKLHNQIILLQTVMTLFIYRLVFIIVGLTGFEPAAIAQARYTPEEQIRNAKIWGGPPTPAEWRVHSEWLKMNCFKKYPEREVARIKRDRQRETEDRERRIREARGEESDLIAAEQEVVDIFRRERDSLLEAENCD